MLPSQHLAEIIQFPGTELVRFEQMIGLVGGVELPHLYCPFHRLISLVSAAYA